MFEGVNTNDLFAQALPLVDPWTITESRFEGEPKELLLTVALKEDTRRLPCPKCDCRGCPIHDRRERSWRHLNFWQYQTTLTAQVPRVSDWMDYCNHERKHQILNYAPPWSHYYSEEVESVA